MINGGQSIILVGATAALLSTLISITFGALAAYLGGAVDTVIMLVADVVLLSNMTYRRRAQGVLRSPYSAIPSRGSRRR